MPKYKRIKLINLSPLHLGRGTDYYDLSATDLSSDTLTSALASVLARQGNADRIKNLLESFVLSSAFPFYKGHYFLPKVNGRISVYIEGHDEAEYRKRLKKIKFIEDSLWTEILCSKSAVKINENQIKDEYLLARGETDFKNPIVKNVVQRVMVPRDNARESEPFYFEWNYFRKDGGLYCLMDAKETENEVLCLFRSLGDFGIGSDKNIGGGHFNVAYDDVSLESVAEGNAQIILSTYIPTKEELEAIDLDNSKYFLLKRGGFMAGSSEESLQHLHRKNVYMFSAGSLFYTKTHLQGTIADVTPDWNNNSMHRVYRSGRALCISINV